MRQRKSRVRLEHKDAPLAKETHFTLIHIQHITWMIPFREKQHSLLSGQLLYFESTFSAKDSFFRCTYKTEKS